MPVLVYLETDVYMCEVIVRVQLVILVTVVNLLKTQSFTLNVCV